MKNGIIALLMLFMAGCGKAPVATTVAHSEVEAVSPESPSRELCLRVKEDTVSHYLVVMEEELLLLQEGLVYHWSLATNDIARSGESEVKLGAFCSLDLRDGQIVDVVLSPEPTPKPSCGWWKGCPPVYGPPQT